MSSKIKIIAPLEPAGDFPVADANTISLGSGGITPQPGSVAEAISELQQELGITPGEGESVSTRLGNIETNLGTYDEGENVKTTIESESESIQEMLSDLRSHINTMVPPTLTASLNKNTVYLIGSTPSDLMIKASINRPLDPPLNLVINGNAVVTTDGSNKPIRSWEEPWAPTRDSIGSLSAKIVIGDEGDSNLEYVSKSVSCHFSAPVYYWVDTNKIDTLEDIPADAQSNNDNLTASHPTSISFTASNQYCYYAHPFGDNNAPTFSVDGNKGGFTKLTSKVEKTVNGKTIMYNIYRTNQALNSVVVNIQ